MKEAKRNYYIEKSKEIHGDIYDFSKAYPLTVKDKTEVICKKHGSFLTTFDSLVNGGCRCPVCSGKYRNTDDYILKLKEVHGDRYDYSKVEYTNAHEKVTVICHEKDEFGNEHGEFYIMAGSLVRGIGCPKCGKHYTYSIEEWIKKANKVHNNKYNYEKVTSTRIKDKVEIICPQHGSFFQTAGSHLQGCGCPKCNGGTVGNKEEFVEKAKEVHHGYYSYNDFIYVNRRVKGDITCPIHGNFKLEPHHHLKGVGCPKCKSSKLENIIISKFNKENIIYEYQSKILDLGLQTVDFYLSDKKVIIECQGEQHYVPVRFSKNITDEDSHNLLLERQKLDEDKYNKAQELGLEIIYFVIPSYFVQNNVNINTPFYENKKVFTQIDEITEYVKTIKQNNSTNDDYVSFVNDFKKNVTKDIILMKDDMLKASNFIIHYVQVSHNERDDLNKITRLYRCKNVNVIHIFEDEYKQRHDIVISKLKHILGLSKNRKKIYARKCIIEEIDNNEASSFLNKNHIQGFSTGTLHLGAYHNNKLIGVMSFLKEQRNNWNLVRFASDIDSVCCGVGGKLFKYFTSHYEFREIKSFADKRWTYNNSDNIYVKLGFEIDSTLMPEYRYFKKDEEPKTRHHKFGFRKQILHKKYGLSLNKTELEMTTELGYDRIWDCGLIKYVYRNPNYNENN